MTIKIVPNGGYVNASSHTEAILALTQQRARDVLVAAGISNLTGSAGATATNVLPAFSKMVDSANDGGSLSSLTHVNTVLTQTLDGLGEVARVANAMAGKVGSNTVTWNGGGTANGAIVSIRGIAATNTGPNAAEMTPVLNAFADAFASVLMVVNGVAAATGETRIRAEFAGTVLDTVPALDVAVTSNGSTGVSEVRMESFVNFARQGVDSMNDMLKKCNQAKSLIQAV